MPTCKKCRIDLTEKSRTQTQGFKKTNYECPACGLYETRTQYIPRDVKEFTNGK